MTAVTNVREGASDILADAKELNAKRNAEVVIEDQAKKEAAAE